MFQKLWRTCFDEESCISHLTGPYTKTRFVGADCYTTNQDFHLDSRDVSET